MKKIYCFIAFIAFAVSMTAETVFTFASAADMSQNQNGITVVIAQGNGSTAPNATTDYQTGQPEMRLYVGNTITISSESELTNIQLVCAKASSNKDYTGLSANSGTLISGGTSTSKTNWIVDSWTGNATQVVFTLVEPGKQRQIQKIIIGGETVIIDSLVNVLPTAEDLDPNYTYSEPTEVLPKDTVIWQEEYAFIDNNILAHCTKGSIVKATDTTFAYFNCNANFTLTFTATQPIKGIAIDGFVRKAFNATCDHGTIQYLTDEDYDLEGWPAVVLMDVNSESVTLTCPKQLRCYDVLFYFQSNPDPLYEGFETVNPQPSAVSYKILQNGQLLIVHKDKIFNAQGIEL